MSRGSPFTARSVGDLPDQFTGGVIYRDGGSRQDIVVARGIAPDGAQAGPCLREYAALRDKLVLDLGGGGRKGSEHSNCQRTREKEKRSAEHSNKDYTQAGKVASAQT